MARFFYSIVAMVAILSGILIGYTTTIIAVVLPLLSKKLHLSTIMQETLVAMILIGALIGSLLGGRLTHLYGRKKVLILSAMLFFLSAFSLFVAENASSIFLLRVLTGIAVGLLTMVTPLYIAEVSPSKWRGTFVSIVQLAITAGTLWAYWMGYFFTDVEEWRILLLLAALPAALLVFSTFFLPESPRWLVLKKRIIEAMQILNMIGEPQSEQELRKIEHAAAIQGNGHWSELLDKKIRPILFITMGLFMFQNLSGIDAILYYSPIVFQLAGFARPEKALAATIFIGSINFLATIIAVWGVDRWGRRPLLLTGLAIMTLSLIALALNIFLAQNQFYWLTLILLTIYVATFAISLGPLPYVFMSELFPLHLRDAGMSIAAAFAWLSNIFVTITFLSLIEISTLAGVFLLYSGICMVALLFSYFHTPETRGSILEDIEENLTQGVKSRYLGRQSTLR